MRTQQQKQHRNQDNNFVCIFQKNEDKALLMKTYLRSSIQHERLICWRFYPLNPILEEA